MTGAIVLLLGILLPGGPGMTEPPAEAVDHAPRRPAVLPHPIHAACDRLQQAERIRIALPDRVLQLDEAIDIASDTSGLRIDMDWPALDAVGVRASFEVRSDGRPGPLDVVLRQLFNDLGDAWERPRIEATAEGLVITTRPGAAALVATMAHPIGDLLVEPRLPSRVPPAVEDQPASVEDADDEDVQVVARRRIVDLVFDMCDWDVWEANGGDLARLRVADDALLVAGPPSIQVAVARLLDQLRVTRPRRLEFKTSIVRRDPARIEEIRLDHQPGSIAFVQAVERLEGGAPVLRHDLDLMLDEPGSATVGTEDLQASIEITARWDRDRRTVVAVIDCRLEGVAADGRRALRTSQEIRVPAGGLVMPLPTGPNQDPLTLLVRARTR